VGSRGVVFFLLLPAKDSFEDGSIATVVVVVMLAKIFRDDKIAWGERGSAIGQGTLVEVVEVAEVVEVVRTEPTNCLHNRVKIANFVEVLTLGRRHEHFRGLVEGLGDRPADASGLCSSSDALVE
jgi:hypothetical protein